MRTKVLALLLLAATLWAGPAATKELVEKQPASINRSTTDAASVLREPSRSRDAWPYTVEWRFSTNNILSLGVTAVQETLIWVSSGGRSATTEPNWVFIFDARTLALVDSFQQAVTTDWGYRDMTYDPVEDVVYAGSDGNRLDKIDATTHALIASYTVSGSTTPSVVRAMAFDGDSLYSANFTNCPVVKFATNGTGSRQVAPIPPYAIYGMAIDLTHNRAFATTADNSGEVIMYDYPSWTVIDTMVMPELGPVHGGCEMWRGDTFLLALAQSDPFDSVFCFRVIPPANDVGVAALLAPAGFLNAGSPVTPAALVKNFGTAAVGSFDVRMEITGGYVSIATVPGLRVGETMTVTFDDWVPAGGGVFTARCSTMLAGDEVTSNDFKTSLAMIADIVYDLESSDAGFVASGSPAPGWQWGEPQTPRPGAHSGSKVWGAPLAGQYPNSLDWQLTTPSYTANVDTPVVAFWHWYQTEMRYDGGNLRISTDGGTTWPIITPWLQYSAPYDDTVYTNGGRGYTGAGPGQWVLALFKIPVNSGTGFKLRWRFTSDGSVVNNGWMIDDVAAVGFAPLQHDVAVQSVLPVGRVRPGDSAHFAVRVVNLGANTETFNVRFQVYDSLLGANRFEGEATVTGLAPAATADIAIGSLRPNIGDVFITTAWTMLAGDENPSNDTLAGRAMCRRGSDPDGFGYIYESTQEGDTVTYNWIDPTGGTQITTWQGSSDDGYATCALPFTFRYYGQDLTSINICTNGFLETSTATTYSNTALPAANITNFIGLYWDDLHPGRGGAVYQYNSPANNYTVFAWVNVPPYSGTGTFTGQVILDNSGRIRCNYQTLPDAVNSSTLGIQGMTGAGNWYHQYCFNGNPANHLPAPNTTVLYYYPPYIGMAEGQRSVVSEKFRLPSPYKRSVLDLPASLGSGVVRVFDLTGREVLKAQLEGQDRQVALDGLRAGLYFVQLDTNLSSELQKLVLVR